MNLKHGFYKRHDRLILGSGAVALVIGVWEVMWGLGWISPLFFSGPSAVARHLYNSLLYGTLVSDIEFSGMNFAIGFLIASFSGIVMGIVLGWYRSIHLLINPFVTVLFSMPRIAMVPLIIMWFGIGMGSKVFIVCLFSFFPILVNTIAGVQALDEDLVRTARSYCATDWQIFRTIALPGSVPFILAGIQQGVSFGLIGVVVGEMYGGSDGKGIGYMVAYGGQTFQTDILFAGVTIISFAGIMFTWLTQRLEQRFSRWKPKRY